MKSAPPPKIGIVSGIGPLAGSDVLAKVLKNAAQEYGAIEDCEYPNLLLSSHGIAGVDNTGSLNDAFEEAIVGMVHELEAQGATILGIACNTAHLYLNKIHLGQDTTLINLIDAVSASAQELSQEYLLLTSSTSKEQKLYQGYLTKYRVPFQQTSDEQQTLLDEAIGLVMAHKLEGAGRLLEQVLASAKKAGFKAVIAGCTELPIAIAHCNDLGDLSVVDSNDELAKALLSAYYKNKKAWR